MNARGATLRRLGAMLAVMLMLTACSSTPSRKSSTPPRKTTAKAPSSRPAAKTRVSPPAPRPATPAPSAPPPVASPPATPSRNGGAYYKDDGPGDAPPEGLASLPDAAPRAEPLHPRANRPYRVFGRQYVPRTHLAPYSQRGVASWYGRRFHGLPTSSGERYDMYAMTAAHPTLPIPSYARVTHLASGRTVVVRVNDRGPFLHGRIMDLSYAAALKLGYLAAGSAAVEVEQLLPGFEAVAAEKAPSPPPAPPPAPPEPAPTSAPDEDPLAPLVAAMMSPDAAATIPDIGNMTPAVAKTDAESVENGQNLFLQLGLFTLRDNAEALRSRVLERVADLDGQLELEVGEGYFRLFVGPYASLGAARAAAERLGESLNIQPFAVWRKKP